MKKDQAQAIIHRLEAFYRLERQATDDIGWIAMALGVSRLNAKRTIDEARRLLKLEDATLCSVCRCLHGYEIKHECE